MSGEDREEAKRGRGAEGLTRENVPGECSAGVPARRGLWVLKGCCGRPWAEMKGQAAWPGGSGGLGRARAGETWPRGWRRVS